MSGIAWVQQNPSSYGYFTESEVNASGVTNYTIGLNEGNMVDCMGRANPSVYGYLRIEVTPRKCKI